MTTRPILSSEIEVEIRNAYLAPELPPDGRMAELGRLMAERPAIVGAVLEIWRLKARALFYLLACEGRGAEVPVLADHMIKFERIIHERLEIAQRGGPEEVLRADSALPGEAYLDTEVFPPKPKG